MEHLSAICKWTSFQTRNNPLSQKIAKDSTYAVVTFSSRQAAVAARHCVADGRGVERWLSLETVPVVSKTLSNCWWIYVLMFLFDSVFFSASIGWRSSLWYDNMSWMWVWPLFNCYHTNAGCFWKSNLTIVIFRLSSCHVKSESKPADNSKVYVRGRWFIFFSSFHLLNESFVYVTELLRL